MNHVESQHVSLRQDGEDFNDLEYVGRAHTRYTPWHGVVLAKLNPSSSMLELNPSSLFDTMELS